MTSCTRTLGIMAAGFFYVRYIHMYTNINTYMCIYIYSHVHIFVDLCIYSCHAGFLPSTAFLGASSQTLGSQAWALITCKEQVDLFSKSSRKPTKSWAVTQSPGWIQKRDPPKTALSSTPEEYEGSELGDPRGALESRRTQSFQKSLITEFILNHT